MGVVRLFHLGEAAVWRPMIMACAILLRTSWIAECVSTREASAAAAEHRKESETAEKRYGWLWNGGDPEAIDKRPVERTVDRESEHARGIRGKGPCGGIDRIIEPGGRRGRGRDRAKGRSRGASGCYKRGGSGFTVVVA